MSGVASTTARGRVVGSETPAIYNVSMPLAGSEYSLALPNAVHKFTIRARVLSELKIAFAAGDTDLVWLTVPPGCGFSEDYVSTKDVTIYLQSDASGNVAEILTWS